MNHLLRTLTESQAKVTFPDVDLCLLLSSVKEGRRQSQDAKLSDPFYDSLEGLLQDLRTITPDNRDAEAFLKPVARSDVPDYYDFIANPMDLQTMLKKVKQKQYKSKREFQDDLDLIWTNCFTYNAAENHPLRQCAKRLKAKAESLLRNITDRKERTDPFIPPELGHSQTSGSLKIRINGVASAHIVNGAVNGRSHRSYSISSYGSHGQANNTAVSVARARPVSRTSPSSFTRSAASSRQDIPFSESPALVRTQEGMTLFDTMDKTLDRVKRNTNTGKLKTDLMDKLIELAPPYDYCEGTDDAGNQPVIKTEPDAMDCLSEEVGEKRKSCELVNARPRKRARFSFSSSSAPGFRQPASIPPPLSFTNAHSQAIDKEELTELWWGAVQSDTLLANGLPRIQVSSSKQAARILARADGQPLPSTSQQDLKTEPHKIEAGPSSLVSLINSNIKAMKRVRHTHARFAALVANTATGADDSIDGTAPMPDDFPTQASAVVHGPGSMWSVHGDEESMDVVEDRVDERPWLQRYIDATRVRDNATSLSHPPIFSGAVIGKEEPVPKVKKKSKRKRRSRLPTGIDMGEEITDSCVRWMGEKVLEHVGFQGTSRAALDVLAGVTKEYLFNVGRTIKFLSDKCSQSMTAEEMILHTLFESGTSKIQDLEQYIADDVKRHGTRLGDLEKKLVSAYRESTANEVQEDEGLFDEEEEEAGALAVGDFADILGEDYLGLRELGIAAEFGMASLTIPKKLLRSKKTQKTSGNASKPNEPPPPYPPPPPFLPLTYDKLDDQIGLLKPYYQARFATRASSLAQNAATRFVVPPAPAWLQSSGISTQDGSKTASSTSSEAAPAAPPEFIIPPDLVLPDDPPNPSQVKVGPLGQIMRPSTASGSGKKKAKGAASAAAAAGQQYGQGSGGSAANSGGSGPQGSGSDVIVNQENSPGKKKKGVTGIGTGNGRKKKDDPSGVTSQPESATQSPVPPPVGFNQSHSQNQNRKATAQGKGVVFPAVVVASA